MKRILLLILAGTFVWSSWAGDLRDLWISPPEQARSWTFWYWMQGAVSKEGITADLESMKQIGLGGAYLMPIKGVPEKPWITPVVEQLSPLWWEMVGFAFREADRLGLQIGFHICDGFALAGGPWITPELSMQKVVWSQIRVAGGGHVSTKLPMPESYKGYYQDIATYAFPAKNGVQVEPSPRVTTSIEEFDASFLPIPNSPGTLRSDAPCWITYQYDLPYTCRSLKIVSGGNNFQSQRLAIFASDDGVNFRKITQLVPPRQGWQNTDSQATYSIEPTTARFFRFEYNKSATEPGSEDLDAAKWKQSLKIEGIYLSSQPQINQFEGKSGAVWRVAPRTTEREIPDGDCVAKQELINISKYVDSQDNLVWNAPAGEWTIMRMGHTSTGHTNATGGGGAGLECDKFNPVAVKLQFDSWFAKAVQVAGKEVAQRTLKMLHVDSWECGSQNWSVGFAEEFVRRRGYDLVEYLPVLAGVPIGSVADSESVLYDVRKTIAELVVDVFYKTLQVQAHKNGCGFSAECVSPTMLSDGMAHYKHSDVPMGEYWFESPTHDKPNDILDAISGAQIYGKNVVQAEAFTQLRTTFTEHPAMLKTLQDRHYALGINRLAYHVYVLNPWLDRAPGMTLDGIGLLFQRDQTWWKLGRAWVDYATRSQALLQFGRPVVDVAVFTGEEYPRRAILPDRLVSFLPGIFGQKRVDSERLRLENYGSPTRQMPAGVTHTANITGAADWIDPLRGYHYTSVNADVLLGGATVVDGRIVLDNGLSFGALVVPGGHQMQPNPEYMSAEVAQKLDQFADQGAKVLIGKLPEKTFEQGANVWLNPEKFINLPYTESDFEPIGVSKDFIATEFGVVEQAQNIAWAHRQGEGVDIYFVSNQEDKSRELEVSLRASGREVELWLPQTGEVVDRVDWEISKGRTEFKLSLEPCESKFVVLRKPTTKMANKAVVFRESVLATIDSPWSVQFDPEFRGAALPVVFERLTSWSEHENVAIRYYSGTAIYENAVTVKKDNKRRYYITFDQIYNMAQVRVNGKLCGTIWTKPYRLEITDALKNGANAVEISVVNTWANRIMGDEDFGAEPDSLRRIWTNGRYRLAEKKLVLSGLVGDVKVVEKHLK